ncbi:triose-phosphate isomerase [Thalassobaculum salexigens]|uniref:triose-phosphate isomerase n=1 Tax=Thalassobaculum salexigens TaxID=455360 RepID=UPI00248D879B|nr:triose-phosphate isomerase [Thalassobaculum salexigens]
MAPRALIAGNWKMNMDRVSSEVLASALAQNVGSVAVDLAVCPPSVYLSPVSVVLGSSGVALGGQDCHTAQNGAHTGDVSPEMLADLGCTYVIVGHSERRTDHGESDADIRAKTTAALAAGLRAIVCVGESLAQREAGETLAVIAAQLAGSVPDADPAALVVAYEPIWAIGTGKVPTTGQIGEVHAFMRAQLRDRFGEGADAIRLLYGGSVKGANAAEIFAVNDVDGALVGGASLTAADFLPIVAALDAA